MTKYRLYIFPIVLSISISGMAQAQAQFPPQPIYKESLVGIGIGPAIPVGEFASTGSDYAGLAQLGFNIQLSYSNEIKPPNWGYLLRINFTSNQINTNSLIDYYTLTNNQVHLDITSTPWVTINFMGGLYCLHPINNLYLEPRLLAGIASTTSPAVKLTAPNQAYIKLNSSSAMSLSLLAGVALKKRRNRNTIGIEMDYYYTRAYFQTVNTSSNFGYSGKNDSFTQPINQFLVSVSLEWLLK